jgi:hypothetical protein
VTVVAVDDRQGRTTNLPPSSRRLPSKRDYAIDLIRRETECTRAEAGGTIDWTVTIVQKARQLKYVTVLPTKKQLRSKYYKIFQVVIPLGQSSRPGSAHLAIEAVALDVSRNEISITHAMQDPGNGEPMFCGIQVNLGALK